MRACNTAVLGEGGLGGSLRKGDWHCRYVRCPGHLCLWSDHRPYYPLGLSCLSPPRPTLLSLRCAGTVPLCLSPVPQLVASLPYYSDRVLAGSSLLSAHKGKSGSAGQADTAQLVHILMVFTKCFSVLDISIYYFFHERSWQICFIFFF